MNQSQALLDAVIRQRDAALNAQAGAEARCDVLAAQIQALQAELKAVAQQNAAAVESGDANSYPDGS